MSTEIEICNSAIHKVRGKRILTLDDNTVEARICKDQYPRLRDRLLRAHPWSFAKGRALLAKLVSVPLFEYGSQYQIPADCLKLLKTNIPIEIKWEREGDLLLTDYVNPAIQYVKLVTPDKFDKIFTEVLSTMLGAELAYPVSQSNPLRDALRKDAKDLLAEARSMNAQERGSIQQVQANEWIETRF